MRVLVVSDTHGNEAGILQAVELFKPLDLLVHCGDGEADCGLLEHFEDIPVIRVAGNCDIGSSAPRELLRILKGVRVLLCHGDRYSVKAGLSGIEARGLEVEAGVILFGHTHRAMAEEHTGMLLVNPGTLFRQAPFHSCALLEITDAGPQATIHPLP